MRSAPAKRSKYTYPEPWDCVFWHEKMVNKLGNYTAWVATEGCQFPRINGYDCLNCKAASKAHLAIDEDYG